MRRSQIVLTLAGTTGIVLLFVPFAYSVVPVPDVLVGEYLGNPSLWLAALPVMILPVPITLSWALVLTGRLPAWGDKAGFLLAGASALGVLTAFAFDPADSALMGMGLFVLAYAGGAWFSSRLRRDRRIPAGAVAMQAAYLVPTAMWLGGLLFDGADVGAYLALVTTVIYATQMTLAATPRRAVLASLLPAAVLFVGGLLGE